MAAALLNHLTPCSHTFVYHFALEAETEVLASTWKL
jgi:hypothetical protein